MSYLIIFWDKSRLQVSDEVGEKLQEAKMTGEIKDFMLGKNLYSMGGINKIITKEASFKVYPAEYQALQAMTDEETSGPPALSGGSKQLQG